MRIPSPAAIAASLLINAGALFSVERAVVKQGVYIQQEESLKAIEAKNQAYDPLDFEFIESPDSPAAEKPSPDTKRISDKDSVARDMEAGGMEGSGPKLAQGVGNQLAQQEGQPSPPPSSGADESPEAAQAQPAPEDEGVGLQAEPEMQPPAQAEQQADQPAQQAAPELPPMPSQGNDRIDTAAMARDPGLGAQMQGEASFEAIGTDAGAYVKAVKEKIWKAWFPYVMSNYPKDYKEASAVVGFVLDANGDLKDVRIIQSQGSPVFSAFCVEAVQTAAPFGPPPKEAMEIWGRDVIEIKFGFHYR